MRRRIFAGGRVQGVWYRASLRDTAEKLGLSGWVRNLPDGRVEAVAEGDAAAVQRLIDWCAVGPPAARVTEVRSAEEPAIGERGFRIRG